MSVAIRLKDVAEAAGVDISTASTILGNKPKAARFAEVTRQRIFEAARKLNYQPNAAAQALATRRAGVIGLTLHNQVPQGWANQYFAQQLVGVEEMCRERGYGLQINQYDLNNVDSFVFPKQVHQKAVDGVILAGYVRSGILERFYEEQIPVVCLGENHDVSVEVPIISVDHVAKAMEAVRYAASMGHRRIAYFSLPRKQKAEIARRISEAIKADPTLRDVVFQTFEQESHLELAKSGHEVLNQVLPLQVAERPTVLIFTTLHVAIGVLKAMRQRNLRCPDDLSVIADNDDDICDVTEPALTAMGQDLVQLGHIAANALIDQLETGQVPQGIRQLRARPLKIRDSVKRLGRSP